MRGNRSRLHIVRAGSDITFGSLKVIGNRIVDSFRGIIKEFKLARHKAPVVESIDAYFLTKILHQEYGGHVLGITDADLKTEDADEFYNVGLCYVWNHENEKACEFLKIAVDDIGINHLGYAWQCYAVYGEAAVKCKRFDEAIDALEKSLQMNPENPSAAYWLKMAKMFKQN